MLEEEKLQELKDNEWVYKDPSISKTFEMGTFQAAIEFVNEVALLAEDLEHHPYIEIKFNMVRLEMYTHDQQELTEKDYEMATLIDDI